MKARNLRAMIARKPRLELESLARSHTKTAVRTLAGIMKEKSVTPMARVAAAKVLLERGWGRPAETHTLVNGGELPLTKIVHEIVHVRETAEEIAAEDAPAMRSASNFKKW